MILHLLWYSVGKIMFNLFEYVEFEISVKLILNVTKFTKQNEL